MSSFHVAWKVTLRDIIAPLEASGFAILRVLPLAALVRPYKIYLPIPTILVQFLSQT